MALAWWPNPIQPNPYGSSWVDFNSYHELSWVEDFNVEDRAAMILLHIKHAKLDEKTSMALNEIKKQRN